jgi:hypothetical protein
MYKLKNIKIYYHGYNVQTGVYNSHKVKNISKVLALYVSTHIL